MSENVKCLACGTVFLIGIEMCPNRYLSDHTEKKMELEAKKLKAKGKIK